MPTPPANGDAVEWEEPPPTKGPRSRVGFRAALEANPGKWAVYDRAAKTRSGSTSFLLGKGLEVTTRKNDDGTYTIYARKPVSK